MNGSNTSPTPARTSKAWWAAVPSAVRTVKGRRGARVGRGLLADIPLVDVPPVDIPFFDIPLFDIPLVDVPLFDIPLFDILPLGIALLSTACLSVGLFRTAFIKVALRGMALLSRGRCHPGGVVELRWMVEIVRS
jgi:hypothetical protein